MFFFLQEISEVGRQGGTPVSQQLKAGAEGLSSRLPWATQETSG